MLAKIEGRRIRKRWLGSITESMDTSLSKHWARVKDREAWRAAVRGHKELDRTEGRNSNNNSVAVGAAEIRISWIL